MTVAQDCDRALALATIIGPQATSATPIRTDGRVRGLQVDGGNVARLNISVKMDVVHWL